MGILNQNSQNLKLEIDFKTHKKIFTANPKFKKNNFRCSKIVPSFKEFAEHFFLLDHHFEPKLRPAKYGDFEQKKGLLNMGILNQHFQNLKLKIDF